MFLAEIHRELNQNCHPERSGGKRSAAAAQSKDPVLPGVTSGLNRSFHADSESHPGSHRIGTSTSQISVPRLSHLSRFWEAIGTPPDSRHLSASAIQRWQSACLSPDRWKIEAGWGRRTLTLRSETQAGTITAPRSLILKKLSTFATSRTVSKPASPATSRPSTQSAPADAPEPEVPPTAAMLPHHDNQ